MFLLICWFTVEDFARMIAEERAINRFRYPRVEVIKGGARGYAKSVTNQGSNWMVGAFLRSTSPRGSERSRSDRFMS